jgi:uncharacterized membrane protein YcaP (DUF421 family)
VLNALLDLLTVALHTAVLYLFLILALSLLGHRQLSDLGLTELVILMLLGSSVETAMVAGNTSLSAGIVSAATLLLSNWALSLLIRRWDWLQGVLIGRPVPLVYNGRFLVSGIGETGLSEDDVRQGMREQGYDDLGQVRLAVLEIDGGISVVPRKPRSV